MPKFILRIKLDLNEFRHVISMHCVDENSKILNRYFEWFLDGGHLYLQLWMNENAKFPNPILKASDNYLKLCGITLLSLKMKHTKFHCNRVIRTILFMNSKISNPQKNVTFYHLFRIFFSTTVST